MDLKARHYVILQALKDHGEMTLQEICDKTGLKYRSLYNESPNACMQLVKARKAYIAEYRRAEGKGGIPKAVFAYGKGFNAEYPGAKTKREKYEVFTNWRRRTTVYKKVAERSVVSIMLGVNPNLRKNK